MRDPGAYYRNNVGGTICLLDAMRAEGVKRIVISGTAAVYGRREHMPITRMFPPLRSIPMA